MNPFNYLVIKTVRFYQLTISPLIGMHCKYEPTCSQYACQCFAHYGFFKSLGLSVWRILRCNPWSYGGHDPAVKKDTIHY